MATERIQIVVTETGSTRVIVNITNISRASERAARSSNLLRNALFGIGAAAVIRGLVRTADAVTNISNRLRLVTDDTDNLNTVFDELLAVSNRTRTAFRSNAELFTRTALATRELGLSQRQVLGFTESLAQATVLSGASAVEATQAIRQLSQGLQNGALRGDEFRSVSEQLPLVLEVIADDLGITRGRLRELAFEGELTAEIIVGAFERAAPRLRAAFGETVPTIGQSFEVLRNSITGLVADFERQNAATRLVSQAILFLAENIDNVARGVIAGGFVLAVNLAINALRALTLAALANPFTAIITALTAVIALLAAFQDEITLTEDGLVTLGDFFRATFQIITEVGAVALDAFIGFVSPVLESLGLIAEGVDVTFFGALQAAAQFGDRFVGVFVGAVAAIRAIFTDGNSIPDIVAQLGVLLVNGIINAFEFASDVIVAFFRGIAAAASASASRISLGFNNIAEAAQQAFAGNFEAAERFASEGIFQLQQAGQQAGTSFVNEFSTELDTLRETDVLARLDSPLREDGRTLGQTVADAFVEGFESTDGLQNLVGTIEERTGLLAEQRRAEQQLADVRRQQQRDRLDDIVGGGRTDRVNSEAEARSVFEGFERGFDQLQDTITDFASASEAVLVNAFRAAEDALVEFVQTGEFNFSAFIDSVLADLTRLLARQALFALLASFGAPGFSFAQTGGVSGFLFGGARQEGGPVNPGRTFLVGEDGPELFTPPSSGTIVPNDELGGGGSNITIINVTDPDEVAAVLASAQGEEAVLNIIQRNPERVRTAVGV